jgi:5-oxoprolinase (ATP-hydrolysing)
VKRWQFAIDVGGTFTDCLAISPAGEYHRAKLLSSAETKRQVATGASTKCIPLQEETLPDHFWDGYSLRVTNEEAKSSVQISRYDEATKSLHLDRPLPSTPQPGQTISLGSTEPAPILAIRTILRCGISDPLPPLDLRLGTTLATNALLTRTGRKTALVVTKGFQNLLDIGYQDRPQLFDLTIRKRVPIVSQTVEATERVAANGDILNPWNPSDVRASLRTLQNAGIDSLAICLMHSYKNPTHELAIGKLAAEMGFRHIYLSHQVSATLGIIDRAETTVADAYLGPILSEYVARIQTCLASTSSLLLMTSAGGLVSPDQFSGKDGLLSGPAGGVVGFAESARQADVKRAIGFDMGGTSTDVSRFDGVIDTVYQMEKNGVRLNTPAVAIETVAAGGGSICGFDGVKLKVGPASAGAIPGPACYGNGGPLTVTDMNFVLGRVSIDDFPFQLALAPVQKKLEQLRSEIEQQTGSKLTCEQLAEGFLSVADSQMAAAIRTMSVSCGTDPRDYTLFAFGGAAPQHACGLARMLSMKKVLIHPDGAILSAVGIGSADQIRSGVVPIYERLDDRVVTNMASRASELAASLSHELRQRVADVTTFQTRIRVELRYTGQTSTLMVNLDDPELLATRFHELHQEVFGYAEQGRPIEAVAVRVEVTAEGHFHGQSVERVTDRSPAGTAEVFVGGTFQSIPVYRERALALDDPTPGPCLVVQSTSTVFVDEHWTVQRTPAGQLALTPDQNHPPADLATTAVDPILLEVFNCRFRAIADQMGSVLRRTASSVNVKERLDFSCAVFTASGDLVANAPHVPVHLGAMSESVRQVLVDHPTLSPGDVIVTNDPFRGGSHLPDVTVITPVFDQAELVFFVASRAHHAEIGGVMPGSMWPHSTTLEEEGVLIPSLKVVDQGEQQLAPLRRLLTSGSYPSRSVDTNMADLQAQIASNQQGVHDLANLTTQYGLPVVKAYMRHIQSAAERKMRRALARLEDGRREFRDRLDDGAVIQVAVTIGGDEAIVDFTGSAPVHTGNLNANLAIVRAAVTYCFRCLIAEDIPLNEGVLAPVQIVLPHGMLNPPNDISPLPAVAGGNVETSQRLVDVILGALGVAAASQGTMNNLLFGDATFGYYETICGGAGATPTGPGADAVQTHMTNTRLTDPEVFEFRFPVRLHIFAIRDDSGGSGLYRGGHGVVRSIEFLRELDVSLLTQRRTTVPFGLAGGGAGRAGRNSLVTTDGERELSSVASFRAQPGDILTIRTPGGGGWKKGDN